MLPFFLDRKGNNVVQSAMSDRPLSVAETHEFEKDLIESMGQALAHAKGEPVDVRLSVVHVPDVRAIREGLHMSQSEFSEAYGIRLGTLKAWEQRRRQPDRTASSYLRAIAGVPQGIRDALHL